jgi:sarcosine oxidase
LDADVAVIGTGTMGSMALWRLARAGIDAIGFEQFGVGHDRSAAGGESRIFRTAYKEGPEYVPTLLRAYELWRELEAESGRDLLTLTGGLMIGDLEEGGMRNVLASFVRFGLSHEILDGTQMAGRYPQHTLFPGEAAVLDRLAGVLRPEFAVISATLRARRLGARVISGTPVVAVEPSSDGVTVRAGGRDHRFAQAVITAGPWTARFAPELARHVSPRKIVMTWYMADDPAAYVPAAFPIFIREHRGVGMFGIPSLDGGSVKVALSDTYGDVGEADDLDHNVAPGDLATVNEAVAACLPGLVPQPIRVSAHMDAYTTDKHALVGALPGARNTWLLGGFSGHGFKMAPAFGQIAADLVQHGETTLPIDHLDPGRFLTV